MPDVASVKDALEPLVVGVIGLDGSGTFVPLTTSPPISGWNWKLPLKMTRVPALATKHFGE